MAAVDDLLTCAICLDWFKSPRRLPCHHVYCLECLRGLVKAETDYITCPECRGDHLIQNGNVDAFQVDGRLQQFIEKQTKLKPGANEDFDNDSDLARCDHCQPACRQCQTMHKVKIIESFLNESRNFQADYLTETQKMTRETQKSVQLNHKANLAKLKTHVLRDFEAVMKKLETRQLTILSIIEEEEKLIADNISKLERADTVCAQHTKMMADFTDNVPQTETLLSFRAQLAERKQLMMSLHDADRTKRILKVELNSEELMDMIVNYGQVFFTDIDYKKDFTLLTTIDGSEFGCVFKHPCGLTVCPITDNVYVSDSTSIRVYGSDGKFKRRHVTNDGPSGLAIDSNQRLIVASRTNNIVRIYNNGRQLIQFFGPSSVKLCAPMGVVCDRNNNIYVVNRNYKRIQVLKPDGTPLTVIGVDQLKNPGCIKINKRQEIIVTDNKLGRVAMFSRYGKLLKYITGEENNELTEPVGVCLDENDRILVADQANENIQVYNDDGTYHSTISQPAAAMKSMGCLAITKSGVIFITDWDGNKIHLITSA